jgi:hypothetical protein
MERIGDGVERELARSGSRDAIPLAAVTAAWPEAVGDAVARNAWPLRLARSGTLHVATATSTWAQELTLLQEDVLDRLRARLGDAAPASLRFEVGPVPAPPALEESPRSKPVAMPNVPPEVEREAASAAAEIEDEELRAVVARAARASLLKTRSGRSFW